MTGDALLTAISCVCCALQQARIRYALIGGAAMPAWGRTRSTADADLLVNVGEGPAAGQSTAVLIESLRRAGLAHLERADRTRVEDKSILHFWFPVREQGFSIRVDIIILDGSEAQEVLDRAVARKVDGFEVIVASCEDLILLKLAAGRPIDEVDAVELLAINHDHLDHGYLKRQADRKNLRPQLLSARKKAEDPLGRQSR